MAVKFLEAFVEWSTTGMEKVEAALAQIKSKVGAASNFKDIGTGLRDALTDVSGSIGKDAGSLLGGAMGGAIGGALGSTLGSAVTGILSNIVGTFTSSIAKAGERERSIHRLAIASGQSEGDAAALRSNVKGMFSGTEFSGQWQHPLQVLAASGQMSNSGIIHTMQLLGNYSAATGGSLEEAAHSYERMVVSGKANERIMTAMPALAERLKEQLAGGNDVRFQEMLQRGQISVGTVNTELERMAGDKGQFGGALKSQKSDALGVLGEMGEKLSGVLADVGQSLWKVLESTGILALLQGLVDFLGMLGHGLLGVIKIIGDVLKYTGITTILNLIGKTISGIAWLIDKIFEGILWIWDHLGFLIGKGWLWNTDTNPKPDKAQNPSAETGVSNTYQLTSMSGLWEHMQQQAISFDADSRDAAKDTANHTKRTADALERMEGKGPANPNEPAEVKLGRWWTS